MTAASPNRYGWVIVGALSVTETITWGIIFYGFPVFLRPMEIDLGASRVAVTGAFSLGLGVSALAAIPVGRWLDRHGARSLMTLGSCLAAALVFLWSRVETTTGLYAVWCVMGLAMAATLYEPAFAAVIQWFTTGRDRALLTLTLAAGLASTIFMPIEAWLLAKIGWRQALVMLAAFLAVTTIPIHAFALRPPPHLARGRDTASARAAAPSAAGIPLTSAARLGVFWILAAAFFVSNFSHTSTTVHLIPYLGQYGYAAALAAAIIGWIGAMQLPGRLLFVPVAARLGARWVTAGIFVAQAAGIGLLAALAWVPSVIPLIVLLGASNGMSTLARATIVSDIFGRRHYASISGAIALGVNGARALAPIGASVLYIALGSYERLFALLAIALGLVSLGVLATNTNTPREDAP